MNHWPQIVYLAIILVGLVATLGGEASSFTRVALVLALRAFVLWLLYEGGFWNGMLL